MADHDQWLHRIERDTVRACLGMALVAWALGRGRLGPPMGVIAGGALIGISYRGIKNGIEATTMGIEPLSDVAETEPALPVDQTELTAQAIQADQVLQAEQRESAAETDRPGEAGHAGPAGQADQADSALPEGPENQARPPRRSLRRRQVVGLVKFFTRYAILTAAAYVIIARLALPPVAVIAGASSLVLAVAAESVRYRFERSSHRSDAAGTHLLL